MELEVEDTKEGKKMKVGMVMKEGQVKEERVGIERKRLHAPPKYLKGK